MRKLLPFLVLFNLSFQLFAQDDVVIDQANYIANYTYTYQEDSLNNERIRSDEMTLYIGNEYSAFEHSGMFFSDSLKRKAKQQANPDAALFEAFSKTSNRSNGGHLTRYKVIKDQNSDTTILAEHIAFSAKHLKAEETFKFNWELVAHSDTLMYQYQCKKATTFFRGRHYQVWYTMQIPINDGPYKFKGLPGLIVRLQDSQSQHVFELSDFRKISNNKPIYFDESKYQKVDMKAYYKTKKADLLILTRAFNGQGEMKMKTNADTGVLTTKLLSNNNYIERL